MKRIKEVAQSESEHDARGIGVVQDDRSQVVELLDDTDAEESRVVTMTMKEECVIVEHTCGKLTKLCYGTSSHGHRMTFSPRYGAEVLDTTVTELGREIASFFAEGAFLSELQDLFDRKGMPYGYASWADGMVVYRGT